LISLEDFDPSSREPPFLTSPTSIEACKMHGIEPEELLLLNPAEHKHVFCKGVSAEVAAQHYSLYTKRREEAFKRVYDQRERLLRNSSVMMSRTKESSKSPMRGSVSQDLQQQRELERLERKQQIELMKLVEKEMSKEKFEEKKLKLEMKAKEREDARLAALAAKQKEIEDKRLQEEEKRWQKAKIEEEQKRLRAEIEAEKERKRLEEETERTRARHKEAMAKDDQRKQKRLAKEYVAAKTLEEQKLFAKQRAAQITERERKRKEMLDEQARIKAHEIRMQSELKEKKLSSVRQVIEQQLMMKQQSLTEKQKQSEEKRRQFEIKRAQQLERARLLAEKKEEELRRIRIANELMEEKKRQEYSINISKAEMRHLELMAQLEQQLKQKQLKAFEKQCRIEMIQSSMGQLQSLKSEQILEKQAKKEEMVESVRQRQKSERQKRVEMAKLKEMDSQLAKARQTKMEEYRRNLVKEKLKEENERIKRLKKEKKVLQSQKLALREQVEVKKAQILEGFSKIKFTAGKLTKEDLFNHLDDMASLGSTSKPSNKPKTGDNGYHEARLEIERIKQAQAEELLTLIQSEESKEAERMRELEVAAKTQHGDLEKGFGLQRAEAYKKIESLAVRHRDRLDREVRRYGLDSQ